MPHGAEFALGDDHVRCGLRLEDLRDLGAAVQRCRRLLDLDADPVAVAVLGADPLLAPLVRRAPGRRVPGSADGAELAVRAVLGQQISVAGARTLAGELVTLCGQPLPEPLAEDGGLTHLFPQPVAIEDTDLAAYAMPEPRRDALRSLARALAGGEIVLDPGADREEAGRRPVDRLLRGDAGAGRPRRVPAHGSRGPALARFGQASDPAGVDARRTVAALAGVRRPAPVGSPRPDADDQAKRNEERGGSVNAYVDTIESPAGPLAFATDDEGALLWLQLTEGEYGRTIEQELEWEGSHVRQDRDATAQAREELLEYTAGRRRTFEVPFVLTGSEWQKAVWGALTRIPFGETRSYAEVAEMVGRPKAARAVGKANATNRLPVVVPCHRVIGVDGSLTGFAGGLHLKTRLLEHEARVLAGASPLPRGISTPA